MVSYYLTLFVFGLSVFASVLSEPLRTSGVFNARSDNSSKIEGCRCFPGDACWPQPAEWATFNLTINGRLVTTVPLATPCHGTTFNSTQCNQIRDSWYNPNTHVSTSSSLMAPFFTNDSCNPFLPPSTPCVVGAYVQYAVAAQSAFEYQATIRFAEQHNIRLVIRNTGHDWLGKSGGAGAISIWTHHMKDIQVLDYKSPYYTGRALKVGAGVQLQDAYRTAHSLGLIVVGGTCPTVGLAGGYTQGGGHGLTVSKYGIGADQALEWEVVTMDHHKRVLRASPDENEDLYWALSGGGGGTYGVVVSLTIKTYPDEQTAAANLTLSNKRISQDVFYAGIETYLASIPKILDADATTTWLNSNESFTVSPAVGVGMNKKQIDELHGPLLRGLDALSINYSKS
jgi:hypothetical protein